MPDIVLAAPVRTPIGRFGGGLASFSAAELGAIAARETIRRAGIDPALIESAVFGNARQAGGGPNPARQIARRAGLPDASTAYTVNMACASGLQAIVSAARAVQGGEAEIVLAGGAESMSRVPYLLERARFGYRLGSAEIVDGMYRDGFFCPLCERVMGETAETLAERYAIARGEQDTYAAESQRRCEEARRAGRFRDEIVPVDLAASKRTSTSPAGAQKHTVRVVPSSQDARSAPRELPAAAGASTSCDDLLDADEYPRDGVTADSLARLPPVFRSGGTVHAGNSSGITDGAASLLVLTESAARRHGIQPAARIVGDAAAGVDPAVMGIGPVPAIRKLEARTGVRLETIDLIELNEAFAAQVLACDRELGFDRSRLNVNGGAIALGHPIGATGARIVVTLLHEMRRRKAQRGLATLCVSGGMGYALLLESAH